MTARSRATPRFLRWYRQRERLVVRASALLLLLAGAAFATPPIRHSVLGLAERAITKRDTDWTSQVERGEALVEAGAFEPAVAFLTVLDSAFPARHVKHRRDRERERILVALGKAELGLGRNERALTAFRRLVEFDPRNYQNHYELATAALQVGEPDEARMHFEHVLAILPGHLPSLQALLGMLFEARDYRGVVSAYERYLHSLRLHELKLQMGDTAFLLEIPVDSAFHDLAAVVNRPPNWGGHLELQTGGLVAEVESITLTAPMLIGRPGIDPVIMRPDSVWLADGTITQPSAPDAPPKVALTLGIHAQPAGIEQLQLRVRIRKPVDPITWTTVERSYRNLLDIDGLTRARAASALLSSVAAVAFIRSPE